MLTFAFVNLTACTNGSQMRLRTLHFDGKRDKSRHRGPGHEALLLETLRKIKAIAVEAKLSVRWDFD
jgi:hypothetical protein